MLPVILIVLAVLFVVLAFLHVVTLLVGLGVALVCLIAFVALHGSAARWF